MFLDGVYLPRADGAPPTFHAAPAPTQADVEAIVHRARRRIMRWLERRGVVRVEAVGSDGAEDVHTAEAFYDGAESEERDPLLARLLAASAAGLPRRDRHTSARRFG